MVSRKLIHMLCVMHPCHPCQVDFQGAESRTVAERRREEERQRKMERIYKERVEAASKDMEGKHYTSQKIIVTSDNNNNNNWFFINSTTPNGQSSVLPKMQWFCEDQGWTFVSQINKRFNMTFMFCFSVRVVPGNSGINDRDGILHEPPFPQIWPYRYPENQ